MDRRKILPDKLQHQQLVEIRVQQRPHNRIEPPVMVVRPLSKVHVHIQSLKLSLPSTAMAADLSLIFGGGKKMTSLLDIKQIMCKA